MYTQRHISVESTMFENLTMFSFYSIEFSPPSSSPASSANAHSKSRNRWKCDFIMNARFIRRFGSWNGILIMNVVASTSQCACCCYTAYSHISHFSYFKLVCFILDENWIKFCEKLMKCMQTTTTTNEMSGLHENRLCLCASANEALKTKSYGAHTHTATRAVQWNDDEFAQRTFNTQAIYTV